MKTFGVLLIAVCLLGVGCEDDPARKVKVETHPPHQAAVQPQQPASASASLTQLASAAAGPTRAHTAHATAHPVQTTTAKSAPASSEISAWLGDFCPIPHEDSPGPSTFTAQGPCEFQHQGLASCQAIGDDFLVALTRKAKQGTLVTFINVENYHGPGSYEGSQIFVAVQNGTTIHRWSSDTISTVVGPGEAFLDISKSRLELEPTLQDCSTLIGPASGYQFQCGALGYANKAGDKVDEVVLGKLQCAGRE